MRIDHVNIVVTDMERSVRFYESALCLRRSFEKMLVGAWIETVTGLPGARAQCVFLATDDPGTRLELIQYLRPTGEALAPASLPYTVGVRHFGFLVDDLEAAVRRLRAAGAVLLSDPVEVPFQVSDLGRKHLCYFHDPDGVLLEVAAYG